MGMQVTPFHTERRIEQRNVCDRAMQDNCMFDDILKFCWWLCSVLQQ